MAYNKVIYKGEVLVDLTQDSVTAETLAVGTTAHDKSGEVIVGTFEGGTKLPELTTPASASDILSGKEAINENGEVIMGTIPTQAAKTITPSTSSQTAVASGRYTIGTITVAPIPSNYEDVTTETTEYTSLNEELEAVINSLPSAGSGGGVTTTTITINAIGTTFYYVGKDGLKQIYNSSTTVQAVVPSICACFADIGGMGVLEYSGLCSTIASTFAYVVFYITGDSSISFHAQIDAG